MESFGYDKKMAKTMLRLGFPAMLDLGGRVLFAYSMVGMLGRYALWFSYPFGWLCSCALAYPRYLIGKWERIKIIDKGE